MSGAGRRPQVFQAAVPPGTRPGGLFEEGHRIQVQCPQHCTVGTVFQMKPYQVQVPPGVGPGMKFMANVSGQLFPVTVPPGMSTGQIMVIHGPSFPPDMIGGSTGGNVQRSGNSSSNSSSNNSNTSTNTNDNDGKKRDRVKSEVKMQSDIPLPKAIVHMQEDEIPNEFICPITQEVMTNPVMAMDGHTYELSAIERWFEGKDTSPKTNDKLPSTVLIPNQAMRSQIIEFFENQQKAQKSQPVEDAGTAPQPRRSSVNKVTDTLTLWQNIVEEKQTGDFVHVTSADGQHRALSDDEKRELEVWHEGLFEDRLAQSRRQGPTQLRDRGWTRGKIGRPLHRRVP